MTAWQNRTVLVTGGAGFVGSNLAHALAVVGARVTVLDNLDPTGGGDTRNLDGSGATLVRGDLADATVLDPLVAAADAVFHCAARTSHPDSMTDPHAALRANVAGTLDLLESCRRSADPPALIHTGTTSQTGPVDAGSGTMDADTPERPSDVYSATKSAAEKLVHVYRQAHGLPCCSVRLSNLYGPRARDNTPRLGFLNFFIGQALRGETITVYGDGEQLRNTTFIDDAVNALLRAGQDPRRVPTGLTLGSAEHHSVVSVAHQAVAAAGAGRVSLVSWPDERKHIEVGDVRIDPAPGRAVLGWEARTSLADGLAATVRFARRKVDA